MRAAQIMRLSRSVGIRVYSNSISIASSNAHFKHTIDRHPLYHKKENDIGFIHEIKSGDHTGRQQNHIWTKQELETAMTTLYRHEPKTIPDKILNGIMYGLYNTFNFVTGYKSEDPDVSAIEWRLIVLESIAGVPGFMAAGFRHFKSLRTLSRDHGWIATLLEEAENERMHLLFCLMIANKSNLTRYLVLAAQLTMTPVLMTMYLLKPQYLNRFVGYLEETACFTYVSIIKNIETPGTKLNLAWKDLPAPPIALGYYRLHPDAKWVDALKCMMADESHHRDVNHTLAEMKSDDPNPFVDMHKADAKIAWRLENEGEPAWPSNHKSNDKCASQ